MAYIDLVTCKVDVLDENNETYRELTVLRKAPKFSGIKKDDQIVIEFSDMYGDDKKNATVVDSISINPESEEAEFICHSMGVEPEKLKKVISVIKVQELKYQEEETDV